MNGFDQAVDLLGSEQPRFTLGVFRSGLDIDHADSVVRVEHGDRIARADLKPLFQASRVTGVEGVQNKRWKRKIVDPIHLLGDLELLENGRASTSTSISRSRARSVNSPMNAQVSGIIKQLVPRFLIA